MSVAERGDRDDFLYFGFGSNLDAARLRIHCPSAQLVSTARLADHRLAFTLESKRNWLGGVADILPEPGAEVWGALWRIDAGESEELDRQEGLFRDPPAYRRVALDVATQPSTLVRDILNGPEPIKSLIDQAKIYKCVDTSHHFLSFFCFPILKKLYDLFLYIAGLSHSK